MTLLHEPKLGDAGIAKLSTVVRSSKDVMHNISIHQMKISFGRSEEGSYEMGKWERGKRKEQKQDTITMTYTYNIPNNKTTTRQTSTTCKRPNRSNCSDVNIFRNSDEIKTFGNALTDRMLYMWRLSK